MASVGGARETRRARIAPLLAAAIALLAVTAPGPAAASTPDPLAVETLLHATLFGGNSWDLVGKLASDGAGNLFVVGYTYSTDLTAGVSNPHDDTLNGTTDAFVAKLDPTGSTLLWATYLGGAGNDLAFAAAASPNGTLYVGGRTYSTDFPTTAGAADRAYTGYSGEGFVTAFNETGAVVWSTYLGGASFDEVTALAVGSDGTVYAAGSTLSLDFPSTNQVWDGSANGRYDAFLAALDPSAGALKYGTYLGGSGNERLTGLAVGPSGRVVVVGTTGSDDFPTTVGAYQSARLGALDLFVTRVNETGGALLYSSYIGGSANDTAGGVALDAAGRATIGGTTVSSDFPTTAGAFDRTGAGQDAFALQLSTDGSALAFSTLLGGAAADSASDIAISPGGDVLLVGQTASNVDFPVSTEAKFPTYLGGATDGYVARLNANGSRLLYSTYFGGRSSDVPASVLALSVDRALVSGRTTSSNFPATSGAHDSSLSGGWDAFAGELKTAYRVSYATSPAGLEVFLDGTALATPFEVACPFDGSHFVGAPGVHRQGDTRYVFSAWSGGQAQTHVLRCVADEAWVALYETEYRWTVTASRPGVTVRVDNVSYAAPHTWWCPEASGAWLDVIINQTANGSRFTFSGWSDLGARAHATACDAPGAVRADFSADYAAAVTTDPPGLSLSVDPAPTGALSSFWCPEGTALVLSAPAVQEFSGTRYAFSGWDDGSAALPRSVTCDGPIQFEARFTPVQHQWTLTTEPPALDLDVGGLPAVSPHTSWCAAGSTVNLTAPSPQEEGGVRFAFVAWAGLGDPVAAPDIAPLCDRPLQLTASFVPEEFRIRLFTDPPGLVLQQGPQTLLTPADVWCPAGLSVLVNAPSPQVGDGVRHVFGEWSTGRTQAHAAPCDGTSDLVATFGEEVQVVFLTQPPGLNITVGGVATRAPAESWCPRGGQLNVSAPALQEEARSRFRFVDWSDGAPREQAVTCMGAGEHTARYSVEYEVRVSTVPAGLVVIVDGEEVTGPVWLFVAEGSTVEVEFPSPQAQGPVVYEFTGWSDGGGQRHWISVAGPMDLVATTGSSGAGDFALAPEFPEVQVGRGSSAVLVVDLREVNNYFGPPVEVTVDGAPEGITARCVPAPIQPGQACALEVRVASDLPPGEYPLTLSASNGTTVRTVRVVVNVPSEGPIEATTTVGWLVPLAAVLVIAAVGGLAVLGFWRWRRGHLRPPAPSSLSETDAVDWRDEAH